METQASYEILYKWEPLITEKGSLIFISTEKKHIEIKNPDEVIIKLISFIKWERRSFRDITHFLKDSDLAISDDKLKALLSDLVRSGLVSQSLTSESKEKEYKTLNRYENFIQWMSITFLKDPIDVLETFSKIQDSKICIIGLGGFGSILAVTLAASGVRNFTLIDGDSVEESNLNRQFFYTQADVGSTKVHSLQRYLGNLNPETEITAIAEYLISESSITKAINGHDLVVLAADAPRLLIENWVDVACKGRQIPYLMAHAGVLGPLYVPKNPGCYKCFQNYYIEDFGLETYAQIVVALSTATQWKYPSFASGPLIMSGIALREIIVLLGNFSRPELQGKIMEIDTYSTAIRDLIPCDTCSEIVIKVK